jgi:plastocyanin
MRLALALLALVALAPAASAREIVIHAGTASDGSLYFEPATLAMDEGERVQLTLVNDDADTPHDWALLEYGGHDIEIYVRGGQTRSINFTASEAGEFRVVCQVVGHKQRGMEGTLEVEEKLLAPLDAFALVPLAAIAAALAIRRRAWR